MGGIRAVVAHKWANGSITYISCHVEAREFLQATANSLTSQLPSALLVEVQEKSEIVTAQALVEHEFGAPLRRVIPAIRQLNKEANQAKRAYETAKIRRPVVAAVECDSSEDSVDEQNRWYIREVLAHSAAQAPAQEELEGVTRALATNDGDDQSALHSAAPIGAEGSGQVERPADAAALSAVEEASASVAEPITNVLAPVPLRSHSRPASASVEEVSTDTGDSAESFPTPRKVRRARQLLEPGGRAQAAIGFDCNSRRSCSIPSGTEGVVVKVDDEDDASIALSEIGRPHAWVLKEQWHKLRVMMDS